jgi:sarcosine oxidase subunit delta
MRLTCPICGDRNIREFTYKGAAGALDRPAPDAGAAAWDAYMHLRENPAGVTRELWHHHAGCGAWLVVTRNTVTHEVLQVELAQEVAR